MKKILALMLCILFVMTALASCDLGKDPAVLASNRDLSKILNKVIELGQPKVIALVKKGLLPRAVRVMVVGMPNVGKSSIINKLIKNDLVEGLDYKSRAIINYRLDNPEWALSDIANAYNEDNNDNMSKSSVRAILLKIMQIAEGVLNE